ncbi:hypothetical protein BKA58DRAFT_425480 [Alternaria rosae]|uniref:uncharacterized protein n=1 Tax=Alternaria rosae TaxID=1187941 RepID=UPI001E8D3733|nr:uncharacterized protein BKA58DRAFT_425480 [Alternaria rosae]KAH6881645.1 hypothetical protein BKA58DRAFT_425480 [Alternaria rosae]
MPTLTSMLPTAGLFLPETLHRADPPTPAPTETEGTRLKYFQRKIGRPKQEPRNSEDRRPSTAIPRETPDDISWDFPAIPTTYYFADYVLSTEKASADIIAFVSIIQQVRQDIDEATRLFISSAVSSFLDAYPNKRRWIESSLLEVRRALNEIGMDMDKAWGHDGDSGTAASKLKLEWGLRNQKKLLKKKQQLDQCHAQLTGAIYVMQTAELCGKPGAIAETPIFEAPVRPWVPHDEKDALRGPYSRQKHRTNHTNVSASNITLVSEAEKDDVETGSVNLVPVELAGSTPADLDIEERHNSQTFLSPQVSREFGHGSSALSRRPRARSDYFRQSVLREPRPCASIDVAPSASNNEDTTIERNDSTLSTQAMFSVPMVARRYRATSIDIQKHSEKHRSLPSELPHLKSQPSLIDDLADYVMPSAASDRLPSREWPNSPILTIPSISVTSSPTTGHTLLVVPETTPIANAMIDDLPDITNETTRAQLSFDQLAKSNEGLAQHPQHAKVNANVPSVHDDDSSLRRNNFASAERTPSPMSYYATSTHTLRSPSALVNVTTFTDDEPVRRPSSQRPSQRMSKRLSQTSSSRSFNATPSPTIATVAETTTTPDSSEETATPPESVPFANPPLPPPQIIAPEASQPILASPTETPAELEDDDVVLSILKQRLRSHKVIKTMAEDLVRQTSTTEAAQQTTDTQQAILSSPVLHKQLISTSKQESHVEVPSTTSSVPVQVDIPHTVPSVPVQTGIPQAPSNGSQIGDAPKKPMSAQAKRRAAHARRMQLAFGDETTA